MILKSQMLLKFHGDKIKWQEPCLPLIHSESHSGSEDK